MNLLFKSFRGIGFKIFLLLAVLLVLIFAIVITVSINFYTHQLENNIRENAIQASDLIKRATRIVMLKNEREDLSKIVANIGREQFIESVRIYDKKGQIQFASNPAEVMQSVSVSDEKCIFCHAEDKPKGTIPHKNRFREHVSETGERILGLINPIQNEPDCYNASCHVHSKSDHFLGLLDIDLSTRALDQKALTTRNSVLATSILIILLGTFLLGAFIHHQIHKPISKLIHGTQQIASLNLDHRIDIDTSTEIGDLARSFNSMATKLQQCNKKLKTQIEEKSEKLKTARNQLILSEKMASMGKLAAVVAHEINNPLSGILSYAKVTLRALQEKPEQLAIVEAIENLKTIAEESKRCGDIVQNLLLFTKQSSGQRLNCDLKMVANKSVELLQHSLDMRELNFIKKMTSEDTHIIRDPALVEQMIIALLVNAIEAAPKKGGEVKLELLKLESENMFRFIISDNGPGIPANAVPHIFEPFYSTKSEDKSTGLGLAVVYGIMQRHGGKINVESEEGKGTRFVVDLPINV